VTLWYKCARHAPAHQPGTAKQQSACCSPAHITRSTKRSIHEQLDECRRTLSPHSMHHQQTLGYRSWRGRQARPGHSARVPPQAQPKMQEVLLCFYRRPSCAAVPATWAAHLPLSHSQRCSRHSHRSQLSEYHSQRLSCTATASCVCFSRRGAAAAAVAQRLTRRWPCGT
jgi:hypothetical protein